MSGPELSIIVISYNTREMTLACLESVHAETSTPFELVVVDNASTDGSPEAIAERFPDAILLAESRNHGFGPAHDVALPHATAPWLLLLNPDTVVLDGAIDKLLAFAKRTPQAGIWGGRTVFADGQLNPTSAWGRMTLFSTISRLFGLSAIFRRSAFFNSEALGDWDRSTEREVDIVTGCFFLMRRADWDRLGGFDPAFVMYGEEADLCLRAQRLGFRPRVTPEATIVHHGGASEAVRADKMVRLMRAKTELVARHFAPGTRRIGKLLFALWPLSRALAWRAIALTGRAGATDNAAIWREVWNRRTEWRTGYGSSL